MMNFTCYLDGKKITDQNLLANFCESEIGVFESLRVYGGVVFRLEEHLKRLSESAQSCGLALPSLSVMRTALDAALQAHKAKDGFVRINFRGEQVFVMVGTRRHNPEIFKKGADLKTSSFRMPSPKASIVQAKSGFYRLQLLDLSPEFGGPNFLVYDYLFLDENHFLTESRVGNFFLVKKGGVLTPPAVSVLNGITRSVVIECVRDLGLFVQETPLTRHDAFNADEAFLTNTSWEILPVRSLDGRLIRTPVPGPITLKLINCFYRKVRGRSSAHSSSRKRGSRKV